jgi:CO dehydrogenase nickel-insertion accessory protein CooC1
MANVMGEYGYKMLVMDTGESNPELYHMFGFDREPKPLMKLLGRFSLGEPELGAKWIAQDKILIEDIPLKFLLENDGLRFMMVGKIEDQFQG